MDNYLNKVIGDRYEIQEVIGIGGMSIVYKAYDRLDDRIVAVKILKDEFMANEEFRMRFKNESKAISILSHPNIVKVFDVSFGDTLQYIVMEYVEGITLKEYIDRQKVLDPKEAVHFVIQILRALQHAHDKGIVHRDIKPQNIILLPNANIKVTDFGIAWFNHMETRNVNESSAIGSVHYVSPEQAKGGPTDGRADVYSVGVVLYEMLTGQVPFEAESDSSVALMQLQNNAKRPSLLNPSIPIGLEQITLRALQKDPADRYQSAAEFLSDLYEFKKNPQIKFDYAYFVDSDPTKHISTPSQPILTTADIPVRITENQSYDEQLFDDDDDDDDERNLTLPILFGVLALLIIAAGVILGFHYKDQVKDMLFNGKFTNSFSRIDKNIEAPDLVNKDIEDVKKTYPDLNLEIKEKKGAGVKPGTIIAQSPEKGTKITADTVIILTVAAREDTILVPDVLGENYTKAQEILEDQGFTVELLPAFYDDVEMDTVVYTIPNKDSFALYGSKVQVFYASENAKKMNKTFVPDLRNYQLETAKRMLLQAGLNVGQVSDVESTEDKKGFVLGQNPAGGTQVDVGTVVTLQVGNGVQGSSSASFYLTLPNLNGRKATVRTYLNGEFVEQYDVVLNGSKVNIVYNGAGSENEFMVFIDNTKYLYGGLDFTKSGNDRFQDVKKKDMYEDAYIPNVVNMTEEDAIAALRAAGFNNISVESVAGDAASSGRVGQQTPVASSLTAYSVATKITILVINRNGGGTPPVDTPSSSENTDPSVTPTSEDPTDQDPTHQTEPTDPDPDTTSENPDVNHENP